MLLQGMDLIQPVVQHVRCMMMATAMSRLHIARDAIVAITSITSFAMLIVQLDNISPKEIA